MILAEAVFPDRRSSLSLEVQAGGVEEGESQGREERPTSVEETLFNSFPLTTEPAHRAVEMMELDVFHSLDPHVPTPAIRLPIGPALTQTMEDGEVGGPFHGEGELP